MKTRLMVATAALLACAPGYAVTCAAGVTHVVDTLLLRDGETAARGTIAVRGPQAPSGSVVPSLVTITLASDGGVDFCLAGGPGWKYDAVFSLVDPVTGRQTEQFSERWIVPRTAVVQTRAMLLGGSSAPQFLVSQQQVNAAGLLAGQLWIWDGTAWIGGYPASSSDAGIADPGTDGVLYRDALNHTRVVAGPGSNCVHVDGTSDTCGTGGSGGTWGSITGTLSDQTDLNAALAAKALAVHTHLISDITSLATTLTAKEATANKGVANGYAGLDSGGKVPAEQLPSSSGMTALVQDTAPQLGGSLDMNGWAIQTVTATEMAFVHGLSSGLQAQLNGKAATGHTHAGVYEPVDATLLRQANLAGSGSATTPARSDHTHAIYAPLASPTFTGTVAGITKTMVGLGNVDNTSDANKPVSTATATALAAKADAGAGNPADCTTNVGTSLCVAAAPYYASTAGATTTTTSGTFAVGTSGSVGSCSTFAANQGVSIAGAGAAGGRYIGTVQSCSGTTLTVSPATSTSVASGTVVQHDETAAFQAAITALASTGGTINVPEGTYLVNGPLQDTSGANAVLKVPTVAASGSSAVLPIVIRGSHPVAEHNTTGTHIVTSQNTGNFIGGYAAGGYYGGFTSYGLYLYNLYLEHTGTNPGVVMVNALHILTLQTDQVAVTSAATATPTNSTGAGIKGPTYANNVRQVIDNTHIYGFYNLGTFGPHTYIGHLSGTWGENCFVFDAGNNTPNGENTVLVAYLWHQLCSKFIVAGAYDTVVDILVADSEVDTSYTIYDPSNRLRGFVNIQIPYADGRSPSTPTAPTISGATNLRVRNIRYPDLVLARPQFNIANAGAVSQVGMAAAGTPGNLLKVASNGWDAIDSGSTGSIAGSVITATQTQPTCNGTGTVTVNGVTAPVRNAVWFTQGASGSADVMQVCMKDSSDVYSWVTK